MKLHKIEKEYIKCGIRVRLDEAKLREAEEIREITTGRIANFFLDKKIARRKADVASGNNVLRAQGAFMQLAADYMVSQFLRMRSPDQSGQTQTSDFMVADDEPLMEREPTLENAGLVSVFIDRQQTIFKDLNESELGKAVLGRVE